MCRLYGFRANEPTKVECTLVRAQNALMVQSREDLRGRANPDGWGIAVFDDSRAEVQRRDTAAFSDLHFSATAERVFAETVVAHVREATVGQVTLVNTHPFHHGPWVMAHNGTVRGFEKVEPELRAETDRDLLAERRGMTDSEMAFLWILSRMRRAGFDLERPGDDSARLAEVLGESVRILAARCHAAGAQRVERLNFLLTDGRVMVATRWHNDLYWVQRFGVHDCEICGIPHVHHHRGKDYRAVVIASEPISHESWQAVPDRSVLLVDAEVRSVLRSI